MVDHAADDKFIDFVSKRCRAYFVSPEPVEKPLPGREMFGCNCYSSGEAAYQDSAMVRCWRSILDWFNILHVNPEHEEIEFVYDDGEKDEQAKPGW